MRVGVTGHQKRDGIDWQWTRGAVHESLSELPPPVEGWSSLAVGADQLFARCILELGGSIVTVVPGDWYEECFGGADLVEYRRLRDSGTSILMEGRTGEEAFLAAGLKVADASDILIAIWDGKPAQGRGGTADVVEHAIRNGTQVIRIDPIARTVSRTAGDDAPPSR